MKSALFKTLCIQNYVCTITDACHQTTEASPFFNSDDCPYNLKCVVIMLGFVL